VLTRRGAASRARRGPAKETRLQKLLDARHISSFRLEEKLRERLGDKAPDPKQVGRWRMGRTEPRRKSCVHLLWAIRELARDETIRIEDVIDFDPDNPANWE